MGGDVCPNARRPGLAVSIHAPAWGATRAPLLSPLRGIVSIHAPAWGATILNARTRSRSLFQSTPPHGGRPTDFLKPQAALKFQSTPPHGGRRALKATHPYTKHVSIHAPAWGATHASQPTANLGKFQSTPPHGGRHWR